MPLPNIYGLRGGANHIGITFGTFGKAPVLVEKPEVNYSAAFHTSM